MSYAQNMCANISGTWISGQNSCFKIFPSNGMNWYDAQSACQSSAASGFSGRLAVTPDNATWTIATNMVKATNYGKNWIGLRSLVNTTVFDSNWKWFMNATTILGSVIWTPPSVSIDGANPADCLRLFPTGQWNDKGCYTSGETGVGYICEYIYSEFSASLRIQIIKTSTLSPM